MGTERLGVAVAQYHAEQDCVTNTRENHRDGRYAKLAKYFRFTMVLDARILHQL